jgi:glucose/mannose transport system substrate-binding protein
LSVTLRSFDKTLTRTPQRPFGGKDATSFELGWAMQGPGELAGSQSSIQVGDFMMQIKSIVTIACAGLVLGAAGCGSDDKTTNNPNNGGDGGSQQVDLISWWTGPGEAQALQALIDVNTRLHPDSPIYNEPAASGEAARNALAQRVDAGNPPDLCQGNAHDLGAFITAHPNSLTPLDSFLDSKSLKSVIFPEVLTDVTLGGQILSMPNNIHRENTLFYNKQIFSDHQLQPPTTLAGFLSACDTLKAAGVTPVATSYQGWILRIMFNSLAMASMGTDKFQVFMSAGTRDDAALNAAIDLFDNVLTNYVNADASDAAVGWTEAAEKVHSGQAAMFLHGDWAKGYFVEKGWTPGTDFGVLAAPDSSDMFWYGVDTISLPAQAKNPTGAFNFLDTIGSIDGQIAFNSLKGSTPIRSDIPLSKLDSESQVTLGEFKNAKYHMLVVGKNAWDTALGNFATSRDKATLFQVYVDNPPVQ